ncbi:stalk domain-containing protein [Filifactor alocis]|uniref:stalk domain-containing protein n=1 Tax=Filifactor alocis TaxID=143361 RepID=UPI003F9FEDED
MKKLASILMTGLLLLAPMQSVHAYDNPELENMEGKMQNVTTYSAKSSANYFVTLNGVKQDVTPIVQNGTTLLPVATVAKLVGYSGTWNNKTKSGTLEKDGVKVAFKLGSKSLKLTKNGTTKTISMLEPVKVIKGRTYLPLRAVGEALGMEVGYNGTTKEISLKTGSETSTEIPKQPSGKIDYEKLTMEEWDELARTNWKAYNEAPYELKHKYEEWKFGVSSPLKPNKPEDNNTKPEQPSTPSKPEQNQNKTYSDEEIIQETFRLVNKERERLGLNKLEMRDDLNGFGKWKVLKLISINEMTHYPNGQGLVEQVKEYGIDTTNKYYAENLAGIDSLEKPDSPYTRWYKSEPHKKAMLNGRYKYVGIQISNETFDYEGNPLRIIVMILSE